MIPQEMKLLNMLSNNNVTFYIPPYQRNYEWTEEQCKVFLEDVKKTCEQNLVLKKNTEHFFGSITFFQTEKVFGQPNKLVLIDGQQRITTTMLFLAALMLVPQGFANTVNFKPGPQVRSPQYPSNKPGHTFRTPPCSPNRRALDPNCPH